uniref:Secretory carrier-associated membrane protein n=1 Tax=Acanthochromis polyacanthus TaxID=80966 RepID=A0A3Q1FIW6_9TELE
LPAKENNWPPLPKFSPVNPCFYQDFEEEIPEDYRRISRPHTKTWLLKKLFMGLFINPPNSKRFLG